MTWWAWLITALGGLGIAATAGAFYGAVGGIKAAAEAAMRDVDEVSELRRLIDELREQAGRHPFDGISTATARSGACATYPVAPTADTFPPYDSFRAARQEAEVVLELRRREIQRQRAIEEPPS